MRGSVLQLEMPHRHDRGNAEKRMRLVMKYVGTISMEDWNEDGIKAVFKSLDGHELYAGRETGRGGFKHYQFALDCAGDLEQYGSANNLGWHIEPCIAWDKAVDYARKTGNYLYIGNSFEEREYQRLIRRPRLGIWFNIIRSVAAAGDRSITVWIDRAGGHGKSSLTYILVRRGKAILVPRTELHPGRMRDFICLHWSGERIIIVDLPRQQEVTPELCNILEDMKDGLMTSGKYGGDRKFMKGVRILVFTNNWVPKDAYESLSKDRWDTHIIDKDGTEHVPKEEEIETEG